MIRLAYADADYAHLGRAAFGLWDELQEESGEDLLLRTGGIDVGVPDAYNLQRIPATYDALGLPYEWLDHDELGRRYPQYRFPEGSIGLYQRDYGILAASRCVATLAARARAHGGDVNDEEKVLEIAPDGDGVSVRTTAGVHRADRVILAAGSWMRLLLAPLGVDLPLAILQEQLAFFRVRDPEAHRPDRLPLMIHRFPDTTMIGSVFPLFDHKGVKVMIDRTGPAVDPASPDRAIDPLLLERLRAYATEILPGVTGEIIETTSCRYTMTPDEDFIVDRLPEYPQVVIASPCSGHGFKFAPVIGQIVADLATAGETPYPTTLFRLDRPALRESWSREVEESRSSREVVGRES